MVKSKDIALRPSKLLIAYQRSLRYFYIGAFLHFMALIGVFLFTIGIDELLAYQNKGLDFNFYIWLILTWWGFWLPFFSELDAYSRYQNYKLVKDKLHVNGFDHRLVKPFMYSKCQRIAVLVAAKDLQLADQVNSYFHSQGYRWYHILPDTWTKNPFVLFYKKFWDKILFTQYYQLQNFYW